MYFYDILYLPASSEWKFFTLPINYYSKTAMPDSAALIIYSGKTDSVRGPNSSLYIDELKLVMEPKGVGVHTPNNQINTKLNSYINWYCIYRNMFWPRNISYHF